MTLRQYFSLVDTIARLSLKAEARRYYFGFWWWVIEPLLYVAVFYIVFEQLLGTRTPDFLMFLIVGKFTFIWFSLKNFFLKSTSQGLLNQKKVKAVLKEKNNI